MLKGKTALVTGSTSGIGLATAQHLASEGCNIVLHGLMPEAEGKALAQSFEQEYKISCMFSDANIKSVEAIKTLLDSAIETFGAIDILVNNAGIQHTENIVDFPEEKYQDIIDINLSSAFYTMKYALPGMQKKGWGRIINIASVHGLVASIDKAAYVASKHGLVGMTKVVAIENAANGVTANAVCPGWVDTPLIGNQIDSIAEQKGISVEEAKVALITAKQPRPEMAKPSEIGALIGFLCSDAAQGITGSAMPIDGGWTAQ
ncbi:3-hydroxybutyrate dehydrogenase [Thalassotalea agarivorans]|uniref:3-hydroxybutyrate dehydrogenase n=1 Tax=Thalassotalea agarivorans TaxID=349064 RepID=A0A1I0CPM8_THASX|nr:3-hydroxybutyrate dehydrogenase [Thalassotalea agarivorans]SET21176.1 3-hydroxybutyrate dehydrogenase [Thalassotalea agarivorans]